MHALAAKADVEGLRTLLAAQPRHRYERSRHNQLALHCVFANLSADTEDEASLQHRLSAARLLLSPSSADEKRERQQQLLWLDNDALLPVHHALKLVCTLSGAALQVGVSALLLLTVDSKTADQLVVAGGNLHETILHMTARAVTAATADALIPFLSALRSLYPALYNAAVVSLDSCGRSALHVLCSLCPPLPLASLLRLAELLYDERLPLVSDVTGALPLHYAVQHDSGAALLDLLSTTGEFDSDAGDFLLLPAVARKDLRGGTPWSLATPVAQSALRDWLAGSYCTEERQAALPALCQRLGVTLP